MKPVIRVAIPMILSVSIFITPGSAQNDETVYGFQEENLNKPREENLSRPREEAQNRQREDRDRPREESYSRPREKNMALSFEPMGLLNGSIPLTFRIKLFDHFSLGLSGYDKVFSFSKTSVTGIGGGLSAKFHLSAPAFENGWYLKPEAMVGYWTVGEDAAKTAGYGVEPKLLAGYDWVWKNGFNLSLGFGVKYLYYSGNKAEIQEITNFGFSELFPNADLGLGWAF